MAQLLDGCHGINGYSVMSYLVDPLIILPRAQPLVYHQFRHQLHQLRRTLLKNNFYFIHVLSAMPDEKQTILLVEDDVFLSGMYKTKFELEGYNVITAEDGFKGFQAAKETHPDIILLDILMPKMDGFEVLQKIRASDDTKHIPVILLTNLGQKDDVKKGLTLGADGYLIKAHFMPSEVMTKVKSVLSQGHQE